MPDPLAPPLPETPPSVAPALSTKARRNNARIGVILFLIYFCLYGGFVYLSAFRADLMGRAAMAGVNLAVIYGLGLIVAAFVLAVIYMLLCQDDSGQISGGVR